MGDDPLVEEMARVWIAGGGDAEGIAWCWKKIQEKVAELAAVERSSHE